MAMKGRNYQNPQIYYLADFTLWSSCHRIQTASGFLFAGLLRWKAGEVWWKSGTPKPRPSHLKHSHLMRFTTGSMLLPFLSHHSVISGSSVVLKCLFFSSKQRDLYDETFRDLVQSALDGFNATIFAYGQTGTGKTFTMQGNVI